MEPWKTLERRTILDQPPFLRVENHIVALPNGRVIPDWAWVVTPDFINVVAVTVESQFLFFRQTKYAVEGDTLAPVGGYLEPNETPIVAAQRELLEETGYQASEWIELGAYPVDGNRGSGAGHFFLARRARRIAEPSADDLEEQELLLLSRTEVEAALARAEFKVMPWAAIVALALLRLKE